MKFINVAIILTATAASSASTSATIDPTTAAQSGLADPLIELKVTPMTLPQNFKFYETREAASKKASEYHNAFVAFRSAVTNAKYAAHKILDNERKGIDEIREVAPFSNYEYFDFTGAGTAVIEAEKNEWDYRVKSTDGITNVSGILQKDVVSGKVNTLKSKADDVLNYVKSKCDGQSLFNCYHKDVDYDPRIKEVKSWIYAAQMMLGQSTELVKTDWRTTVDSINVPQGRFSVTSIDSSLNLRNLMNNSEFTAAVASLRANLTALITRMRNASENKKAIMDDLTLRSNLVRAVLAKPEDSELTIEIVERRVRAFERIAEGIIRYLKMGRPLDNTMIAKLIKTWIMAVQMFRDGGMEEMSKYATVSFPTVVELAPAPVQTTESSVGDKRPRSDSTSSTGSTDSTSSTKSNSSIFGGITKMLGF